MGFRCPACGVDFGKNRDLWKAHTEICSNGLANALVVMVDEAEKANKAAKLKTPQRIRIDTYYDLTCDACSRSWSTDFNGNERRMDHFGGGMGMEIDKKRLYRLAKKTGWRCINGRTVCPECGAKEDCDVSE